MERAEGIEPSSSVWKTEVLTITQRPLTPPRYAIGVRGSRWTSAPLPPNCVKIWLSALKLSQSSGDFCHRTDVAAQLPSQHLIARQAGQTGAGLDLLNHVQCAQVRAG